MWKVARVGEAVTQVRVAASCTDGAGRPGGEGTDPVRMQIAR